MKSIRYLVLTDIFDGFEVDDIQSMIRLLLYSNEIHIEGLIACTSCFVKKDTLRREGIIHKLIDAYAQVLPNLRVHANGWPTAEYLHSVTCSGIDEFGLFPGKGFAHSRYADNPGVQQIIAAVDKLDQRPLYIGLWGGANTLAQAVWQVEKSRSRQELDAFLGKLRIYSISDQDHASRWLRKRYGDRLFWIVSPSKGSWFGNWSYWRATWPGISADSAKHGSEDGVRRTGGFSGADTERIDHQWLKEHIISKGKLGAMYPLPQYITEGDTPSLLWLIPNGLNDPEHPDHGGWGGRYRFYKPPWEQFGVWEYHPIWTNVSDTVLGVDGQKHTSPQATIWRWRTAFQNDFAARMDWTVKTSFEQANHPPRVWIKEAIRRVAAGQTVHLEVEAADPNGGQCDYRWYVYPEAGTCPLTGQLTATQNRAELIVPQGQAGQTLHVITEVTNRCQPPLTRYGRFIIKIVNE